MATLEDLRIPEIKKILRDVEVDATDILAAKTKFELLELAELHGIVSVPDEWTIKKIKERRRQQRDKAIDSANSLAAKAENDASGQRQGLLGKGMSFFSRREATMRPDMELRSTTVAGGSAISVVEGAGKPPTTPAGGSREAQGSLASRMSERRLERAKGRASERGRHNQVPLTPVRPPLFRTLGELKMAGLDDEGALQAIVDARASHSLPPTGHAADPGLISLAELRAAGFSPAQLSRTAFSAKLLKEVGYAASEMLGDPKISPTVLRELGVGAAPLIEAGLSTFQLRAAGFKPVRARAGREREREGGRERGREG